MTVKAASDVLRTAPKEMLSLIKAGKRVVHISPAGANVIDPFEIEDPRMMCPEFDRVKFASNGCYYNCDWCFLKGTYRANQNFINVHVQYDEIKKMITKHIKTVNRPVMFDSGELADSLAMEHLTKAGQEFIPWFGEQENGYLYMLTKSDNVDNLLNLKHNNHTILAWSLNAPSVSEAFEVGAPPFEQRLIAAKKAQDSGYPIRVRLDPILWGGGCFDEYAETIERIFKVLTPERITLGTLRLEKAFYQNRNSLLESVLTKSLCSELVPMLPDHEGSVGKYSFPVEQRIKMFKFAIEEIKKYSQCNIALCKEIKPVWEAVGLDLKECKCVCQFTHADMVNRPAKEPKAMATEKKVKVAPEPKKQSGPLKVIADAVYEPRTLYDLDLDLLAPDPEQPRKSIDETELKELTSSIIKHGVLQPILFRKNEKGELFIVSGERRYQASRLAKKETIPAIFTTGNAAEIALVENLLRVDLTAIEEAEALQRLKSDAKYTNKQLASVIGKAESTISEILKLNELPEKLRNKYRTDKTLSKRRLLEVAKASTPEAMMKHFKKLVKNEAGRDELRQAREPRHRELEAIFKTMIGGLTTKINEVNFAEIDEAKKSVIEKELNDLVDLIDKKLGNV